MSWRAFVAAIGSPAVLAALAGAGAASLWTGNVSAMWAVGSAMALYAAMIGLVPGMRRWARASALALGPAPRMALAEPDALNTLAPSQRAHYDALVEVKRRILERYRALPGGSVLAADTEGRLNELLGAFVRLVSTLNAYRSFLGAGERQAVEAELASLQGAITGDVPEAVRAVKARRVDILKKRLQRFVQAEEHREVVSHQLAGIEDVLHLTHEQSITLRDPEVVNRQLDTLTAEVVASQEALRDLDAFMHAVDEGVSVGSSAGSSQERVR